MACGSGSFLIGAYKYLLDCVIGNPPYIKEYTDKSVFEPLHNNECYMGKMDFWYFFGYKAIKLINDNGLRHKKMKPAAHIGSAST